MGALHTFAAYNSCIQWSLGKLQGQGVTHFWRIRMEDDPNGGLCKLFSVYLGYFKQGENDNIIYGTKCFLLGHGIFLQHPAWYMLRVNC